MADVTVHVDEERLVVVVDQGPARLFVDVDELRQLRIKLDAAYWQLARPGPGQSGRAASGGYQGYRCAGVTRPAVGVQNALPGLEATPTAGAVGAKLPASAW